MEVCNCSMFCCTLLYVHSSIAIILMGKRELIALLNLSSLCLVMVFPDHTHLLFFSLLFPISNILINIHEYNF